MWRYRCEKVNLLTTKKQWVGNLLTSLSHCLSHWGRVTHKCVSKLTIIGSDNGLSPNQRQAIIWTNAGILLIRPIGTNFSEILIEIHIFSFKKMHLKMSSGKGRPFCLGLNMLKVVTWFLCYKIWLMWQCSHSQSAWWLLMAWCLFNARTSATIVMIGTSRHMSGVPNVMW